MSLSRHGGLGSLGDPLGLSGGLSFGLFSSPAPVVNPNLLTKTEQFDNVVWVKAAGASVVANATTDPLGGSTADQINNGAASTITQVSSTAAISGSGVAAPSPGSTWTRSSVTATFNTGTFTFSVWLKDPLDSGSLVQLRLIVSGGFVTCQIRDGGDGLTYYAWGAKLEIGSSPTGTAATYGAVN